ncbi:MAG: tyrosine-type recombinase/integrase [Acidimicrobiales bacterium]
MRPTKTTKKHPQVIDLDFGVSVHAPATPGGYWRLRWTEEDATRRDTTARDRVAAMAKAESVVERLASGRPPALERALGAAIVEVYLDRTRTRWSDRHREAQESYCARFVTPVIGGLRVRSLTRSHFQRILDQAGSATVAAHLRRTLSAMVNVSLDEGLLLVSQDVMRALRWHPPAGYVIPAHDPEELDDLGGVEEADIPTAGAVHALAAAAAQLHDVWWRELEFLLVAYSGMRWGEHAALTADRLQAPRRRIVIDRQVIETREGLGLSAPKNRRRRITMYPARTPAGIDLAEMVERRLGELGPTDLVFPSPKGHWARRSNFRRNLFVPAASGAAWPVRADGRFVWTFHSLRHVFATWALHQPGARLEDVSRLLGHSSIRVTQDIYIGVDSEIYDRFFLATAG